jgi:hypothetical protein
MSKITAKLPHLISLSLSLSLSFLFPNSKMWAYKKNIAFCSPIRSSRLFKTEYFFLKILSLLFKKRRHPLTDIQHSINKPLSTHLSFFFFWFKPTREVNQLCMCVFLKTRLHQETDLCMNNACFDYVLSIRVSVEIRFIPLHTTFRFLDQSIDREGRCLERAWVSCMNLDPCGKTEKGVLGFKRRVETHHRMGGFFQGCRTVCERRHAGQDLILEGGCREGRENRSRLLYSVPQNRNLFFFIYFFISFMKVKRTSKQRNYEIYIGKTLFFCGGRLLTSRAIWAFGVSIVLLLAPSILFLLFTYLYST